MILLILTLSQFHSSSLKPMFKILIYYSKLEGKID